MKQLFNRIIACQALTWIMFAFNPASATNYYVDPSSATSKPVGTPQDPWTNLEQVNVSMKQFLPGDTVFLKRGEIYTDILRIRCVGKPDQPVVFTTYGSSQIPPLFLYKKQQEDELQNMVEIINSRYVEIRDIQISDDKLKLMDESAMARIRFAFSIDSSDYCVIRNCHVSFTGVGVNIIGAHNEIRDCRFTNMRMVWNTPGGDDDYGANGVVMAGPDNLISGCYFYQCWGKSYDYEYDGGAVEMYGEHCQNNRIVGNTALYCNGFMEIGSREGGHCSNTQVDSNLIVNCGDILYISTDGQFAIRVSGLVFKNNKLIQTEEVLTRPKNLISMTRPIKEPGIMTLTGNVFWLGTSVNIFKTGLFRNDQVSHSDNIYFFSGGKLNLEPAPSEKIYTAGQGDWQQKALGDVARINPVLYPFQYLIPYWRLFILP